MTDRYIGFVVLLEKPVRQDDFDDSLKVALEMLKGVKEVKPIRHGVDFDLSMMQAKRDLLQKLFDMIKEEGM